MKYQRLAFLLVVAGMTGCQAPQLVPSPTTSTLTSSGYHTANLEDERLKKLFHAWWEWRKKHKKHLIDPIAAPTPEPTPSVADGTLTLRVPGAADSWDSMTMKVQNPADPAAPYTATLLRGSDFTASGSDWVATGSALPDVPPNKDYVYTVSLWSGGPLGTLVGEGRLTLMMNPGHNDVLVPVTAYPALGLAGLDPIALPGATITLTGQGFSIDPQQDQVTLGGMPATVTSASSVSLQVTVPGLALGSYTCWVQVGANMVGRTGFQVKAASSSPSTSGI